MCGTTCVAGQSTQGMQVPGCRVSVGQVQDQRQLWSRRPWLGVSAASVSGALAHLPAVNGPFVSNWQVALAHDHIGTANIRTLYVFE